MIDKGTAVSESGQTFADVFFTEINDNPRILSVEPTKRIQDILQKDADNEETGVQIKGNCFSALLYILGYLEEERHVYPLTESEVESVMAAKGYERVDEYTPLNPNYEVQPGDVILIINKHRRKAWDKPTENIFAHVMMVNPKDAQEIIHRHGPNMRLVVEKIPSAYNDFRKDFEDNNSPLRSDYEQIVYRKKISDRG